MTRHHNTVTISVTRIPLPFSRQSTLTRLLNRARRNIVSQNITIQIRIARRLTSRLNTLTHNNIKIRPRVTRHMRRTTIRKLRTVTRIERHSQTSHQRHVNRVTPQRHLNRQLIRGTITIIKTTKKEGSELIRQKSSLLQKEDLTRAPSVVQTIEPRQSPSFQLPTPV